MRLKTYSMDDIYKLQTVLNKASGILVMFGDQPATDVPVANLMENIREMGHSRKTAVIKLVFPDNVELPDASYRQWFSIPQHPVIWPLFTEHLKRKLKMPRKSKYGLKLPNGKYYWIKNSVPLKLLLEHYPDLLVMIDDKSNEPQPVPPIRHAIAVAKRNRRVSDNPCNSVANGNELRDMDAGTPSSVDCGSGCSVPQDTEQPNTDCHMVSEVPF